MQFLKVLFGIHSKEHLLHQKRKALVVLENLNNLLGDK